jgi:flagellar basal-body rod protein FlgB
MKDGITEFYDSGDVPMSSINNIFDVIQSGINAESLRQKTIASNVANAQTPGYRRVDVGFKEMLAKALESPGDTNMDDIEPEIYQTMNTPLNEKNNDVALEVEVGEMVKNTLRHKTYIRLLQKKYQQIDLAINVR